MAQDRGRYVNIRSESKGGTAFVQGEVDTYLLERMEAEARMRGVTTTALLNEIIKTTLVNRYAE